ncbi:type II CRISPR-associated endonuclease Cas1 [Sinimarinibacterium flocculans]|uniref:CRISPR-associated endonuclease Cas1 n=1 Tax=Sinimarinibacterium flocculans TaxID=985250 RepID=A0A318EFF9_9GAMM|nr:type II CRISPR-associated endonuclease Cas1 [Sinimarinibacterium flocculans]PXV71553.1 CRISPR-associated Cas1 family protein [Sinimarinibacterium flocculans]
MLGRIVEIAQDGRRLSVDRGFLVIRDHEQELGRIPLDDIAAVIGNAHGLGYTKNVLVALAERKVPLVVSGANHSPVAFLWPLEGHHEQAGRMDSQLDASLPLKKRLWSQLVKAKLQQQAAVLEACGESPALITALIPKVRIGDPDNIEAQAARRYWSRVMGEGFTRNQEGDGINALLNYAYTILRSATARAVLAAGLHPSLGLFHRSRQNGMRLVDDLMEPYRPVMDWRVRELHRAGASTVNPEAKRQLAHTLYLDMDSEAGRTPLMVCVQRLAVSLAQVFAGERDKLDFALPLRPLLFTESGSSAF